ncbi:MAG: nucleotidyltransferase domain-containing protein [Sulfuricurvum sp.]|uniref:nucleotidyltransferase domain-containing protein n=1 Tax=Sulfuricurvum sp. TaxID=2025608 RepID=UPI0025E476CD|nr:nucleotidyltransferase domain-containing protein [Sulfuricurvum sp.]MBV5321551.1 nucleotidyltransferase domain-containing protein [Sulfuricurvum sp.]
MILNMDTLKDEIIERLKPLDPDKIILFGSYAYGTPDEESDIDLFLVKDIDPSHAREYRLAARKQLRDLIFKHEIGFDVLAASNNFLHSREDHFYRVDILQNGKILYAK